MALSGNKAPVTGNPEDTVPDQAKYGMPRGPGDGDAAARASALNNAGPVPLELTDEGRCPLDGLPAGNCAHFPGPQVVTGPDGQAFYDEGHATAEKDAQRSREGADKEPRKG